MMKKLLSLLAPSDTEAPRPERIPLATAVLLLEIAHADGDFSAAEEAEIKRLLEESFSLDESTRVELMALATETQRKSVDLHQFTSQINNNFSQEEKVEIIESFWQLAFADGKLDAHEEAMMRQLGHLIGLPHRKLIDAKLRVRERIDC
jgi:uncharacterized tellurite resistance protein B-like protein